MSILASLVRAYERLPEKDRPPFGYALQDIQFFLEIDMDGKPLGKLQAFEYDRKNRPASRILMVPYFGGRSGSNAPPYFLWDNTSYVFGASRKPGFDAEKRFHAFREYHLNALKLSNNLELLAFRNFLLAWSPNQFDELAFPIEAKDRNTVFRLTGKANFIHESEAAAECWRTLFLPDTIGEAICLVSGQRQAIARLHPPIKTFENPARIVSFDKDNDSFSSYGHLQAENAPTGIVAAFAYTAVLNRFLARDSGHRIQIGDASTVFWADSGDPDAADLAVSFFAAMIEPGSEDEANARKVGDQLARIRRGEPLATVEPKLAEGVRFHVLGLSPNAARLSVRFWFDDDFGVLAENYRRFVSDMAISPPHTEPNPALWRYLRETAVLGKSENVAPSLAGEWLRSILTGARYPATLLSSVLARIRADGRVNALRAAMLKAVLIRNHRLEVPVALEPDETNKGYVLGRLFAVYEEIQRAALGGKVNATIKDKFYGSASATPQRVFAALDRGAANHLAKLGKISPGRKVNLTKLLAEVMDGMSPAEEPFPVSLPAKDQALFGLGYFHQHSDFFKTAAEKASATQPANQESE